MPAFLIHVEDLELDAVDRECVAVGGAACTRFTSFALQAIKKLGQRG